MNREITYKLFAKSFYYPDIELAKSVFNGEILFAQTGLAKPDEINRLYEWIERFMSEKDLLEALQVEHTGLFINAFPKLIAPPYKSYYLENELYGESTSEILQNYRDFGFNISTQLKEPADHLAVELEFVYRLNEMGESKSVQKIFVQEHILSWIDKLYQRVAEYAALPFYPFILRELIDFLTKDVEQPEHVLTGVAQ